MLLGATTAYLYTSLITIHSMMSSVSVHLFPTWHRVQTSQKTWYPTECACRWHVGGSRMFMVPLERAEWLCQQQSYSILLAEELTSTTYQQITSCHLNLHWQSPLNTPKYVAHIPSWLHMPCSSVWFMLVTCTNTHGELQVQPLEANVAQLLYKG